MAIMFYKIKQKNLALNKELIANFVKHNVLYISEKNNKE